MNNTLPQPVAETELNKNTPHGHTNRFNNPQLITPIPKKPFPTVQSNKKHISFQEQSIHSPKPTLDEKRQMLRSPDSTHGDNHNNNVNDNRTSSPSSNNREEQKNLSSYPIDENTHHRYREPSLSIKPEPNLRSCLSPPQDYDPKTLDYTHQNYYYDSKPSQTRDQDYSISPLQNTSMSKLHPSFLVEQDCISPNKHGLLGINKSGVATPITDEGFAHSHVPYTPMIDSESNSIKSTSPISKSPTNKVPLFPQQKSPKSTNGTKSNSPNTLVSELLNKSSPKEKIDEQLINSPPEITEENQKLHLLIGITGCISINNNIFLIIEKLFEIYTKEKLEIQVILTKSAEYILSEKLYKFENYGVKVWFHGDGTKHFIMSKIKDNSKSSTNSFNNNSNKTPNLLNQFTLSYDLQRWTDVLLLAPLSANSMAKLINGLADNLITELLHIWPPPQLFSSNDDLPISNNNNIHNNSNNDSTVLTNNLASSKPIIAVLALTSSMYSHPITKKQLALLQETYPNMSILKPVEKCVDIDGNISMGGMRSWREVVDFVLKKLGQPPVEEDDDDEEDDEDEEEGDEKEDEDEEEKLEGLDGEKQEESDIRTNLKPDNGAVKDDEDDLKKRSNEPKPHRAKSTSGLNSSKVPVTNKELKEHTRLASQNAIINSGGSNKPLSPPIIISTETPKSSQ